MTALRLLIGLLAGRTIVVLMPAQPVEVQSEHFRIDVVWNRETREARVITNTSRHVAVHLHTDLLTIPAPQETTTEYTHALGQALHQPGGQA
ncbi:hypothetical protein D3875_03020 [Deinococcus cavernae]|uniref:Uncharacterized protein n=1 Tax=Deinococcus cavernae TaxID=2320857 RepID=A0A418VFT4_9DEIO|nr:hypothetical protein [Deinococcus cavernae]RJF74984.1 hypothetical protein D3875_03020 [Deinococcus cavernae]